MRTMDGYVRRSKSKATDYSPAEQEAAIRLWAEQNGVMLGTMSAQSLPYFLLSGGRERESLFQSVHLVTWP